MLRSQAHTKHGSEDAPLTFLEAAQPMPNNHMLKSEANFGCAVQKQALTCQCELCN
jgi:hypothetical protein